MSTDLTVVLEDRPGTMAEMGAALGKAGVNIEGMCGFPSEGKGMVHLLVEDAAAAKRALQAPGFEVRDEREVLVLAIEDKPGAFGVVAQRLASAGVNINLGYLATGNRIVLGVDDLDKARAAL